MIPIRWDKVVQEKYGEKLNEKRRISTAFFNFNFNFS
jgi:hypothetical protein